MTTLIKHTEKGENPKFYSQFVHKETIGGASKTLFSAYQLIDVQEGNPRYSWEGGKISLALWKQIVSFFEHTQRLHKCESQVRLYYNKRTEVWAAWAYPQKLGTGMFTKEVTEGTGPLIERRNRERAQFGADWEEFGTVHHHCEASAFQSGTDSTDEKNRSGLHITVGHVTKNSYDLHWRVTFKKGNNVLFYNSGGLDLSEWFESPPDLAQVPVKYRVQIDEERAIIQELKRPDPTVPFPDEWKNNLIEPDPVSRSVYNPGQYHGEDYYQQPGFRGSGFGASRKDANKVIRYIDENKDIYGVDMETFAIVYLAVRQLDGVANWDIGQAAEMILQGDTKEALEDPLLANQQPGTSTLPWLKQKKAAHENEGKAGKASKVPGKDNK